MPMATATHKQQFTCWVVDNVLEHGQTVNLRNNFIIHRGLIRKKSDKLVHHHFKTQNHTFRDVTITILETLKSTKRELLDNLERQWIT